MITRPSARALRRVLTSAAALTALALLTVAASPEASAGSSPPASPAAASAAGATARVHAILRATAVQTSSDVTGDIDWMLAHRGRHATYGLWKGTGATCVRCAGGVPTAAAAIAATTGDVRMLHIATTGFDRLISAHYRPRAGTIEPPMGQEGGPDIQTALFAGELGESVLALGPMLDPAHRARYTAVVAAGADFLIRNGNLRWYTNGNIVLANAAAMAAAYALAGRPRYEAAYQTAWAFALHPSQGRWPGYGIRYVVRPRRADGADGRAFLTESGAGGMGFDAEYTEMQMSTAARIYLINADPRALRLVNLEMNQLLPRVRRSDWMLNTSRGTRHVELGRWESFRTGAVAVLAATDRPGFASMVARQVAAVAASVHSELPYANPGTQYSYGLDLAAVLLAPGLQHTPAGTPGR